VSYLIDSDWVANYLRGRPDAVALLPALDGRAISLITFGEIYEGIYYGADPRASELAFRSFLRGVDVLLLNRAIMRRFARIRGDFAGEGKSSATPTS
jgi:predicted nucleic acid-binding protein